MRELSYGAVVLATMAVAAMVVGGIALANTVSPAQTGSVTQLDAPDNATIGETIEVEATVTNTANESGNVTVEYRFNGTLQSNTTLDLAAGNSTNVSFAFNTSGLEPGDYEHGIYTDDDAATATITLEASDGSGADPGEYASFEETSPLTAQQVDPPNLSGKFRVESEHLDNTTVELVTDNATNATFDITVTGHATNVTFYLQTQAVEATQDLDNLTAKLDGDGLDYHVNETAGPGDSPWILFQVDHFSTRTVTFERTNADAPAVCDYAGPQGDVDTSGLLDAIDDWRQGEIDASVLLEAIDGWRSATPVEGCA